MRRTCPRPGVVLAMTMTMTRMTDPVGDDVGAMITTTIMVVGGT
jgi:hypothetical protein